MAEQRSQSRNTSRDGCIRVAKVGKRNITPIKGARWYYGGEFARTSTMGATRMPTQAADAGALPLRSSAASSTPH